MKKILAFLFQTSFVTCCSIFTHSPIAAQPVTTDATLPEPTEVTPTDAGVEINGGTAQGGNLFHSFSDFSVPTGTEAHFNNNADVTNILSRVTGRNISNIDGLIRNNGSANLFLINPAGIIFGADASLDIGGSFLATTADSLLFDESGEFSATDTQAEPILTINAPIGLNFRDNPQPIRNHSTVNGVGLEVHPGKNITLAGGELNFDGGILNAPGGKIELGGLSTAGEVEISDNGSLTFPEDATKADVTLTNGAAVNIAANGNGSININARNLSLTHESQFTAGIAENVSVSNAQAGDITLNAQGAIALRGSSSISNQVYPNGIGNGGDIKINSHSLDLAEASFISSSTFGQGDAGDITINTQQDLNIVGEGRTDPNDNSPGIAIASSTFSSTNANANANAGNITINAGSFSLTDFIAIEASNYSTVGGNAGDVAINAQDNVLISESGINSITGLGNAGNIEIQANTIRTENYSFVDSSNLGIGNSGNIQFQANSIFMGTPFIRSQIVDGEAGNIDIFAQDSLNIDGTGASASGITIASLGSGNGGNINIKANSFTLANGAILNAIANDTGNGGKIAIDANTIDINQALINATSFGTGKGGEIEINAADSVNLVNDAKISVNSQGQGDAGNLIIATQDLTLEEESSLSAETVASNGGDIQLSVSNILSLQNSNISTTAGSEGINADGGNIEINANFVVAMPSGDSNITANAFQGRGGAINIDNQGIFGIAPRELNPNTNDINASSEIEGLDGNITINAIGFEAFQATAEPPTNIIKSDGVIARVCEPAQIADNILSDTESTLTIKDRNLNSSQPIDLLTSNEILDDTQSAFSDRQPRKKRKAASKLESPIPTAQGSIHAARGAIRQADGSIILTAHDTNANSSERVPSHSRNCG